MPGYLTYRGVACQYESADHRRLPASNISVTSVDSRLINDHHQVCLIVVVYAAVIAAVKHYWFSPK
jgi:hypothetical protein